MLSVIALLRAGTVTRGQLCWLLDRIRLGASWLVGARPGGAGKTAVMSALLAMLPEDERVYLTSPGAGWENAKPGECLVAYEIGTGDYEAYIWGRDLVRMAALGGKGCRLVSNLHADTLEQAREQVVAQNGVPESDFAAFDTFIPLALARTTEGRTRRVVAEMSYCVEGKWRPFRPERHLPSDKEVEINAFLETCLDRGVVEIDAVREAWLEELVGAIREPPLHPDSQMLSGAETTSGRNSSS